MASAALAPADIAQPIRTILRTQRNARVMLAEVRRSRSRRAHTPDASGVPVPYDYLVLAPSGAVDNYFGHSEAWRQYAPGMKEVEEATLIRSRLLRSFESAEILKTTPPSAPLTSPSSSSAAATTGVENTPGADSRFSPVDVIPRDFRVADTRAARVILIEAGAPRLLPALLPGLLGVAPLEQLQDLGVEVRLGQPVTQVMDTDGVVRVGGEYLRQLQRHLGRRRARGALAATLGVAAGLPGLAHRRGPGLLAPGAPSRYS